MLSKFNIINCLQKREYGYNGFRKNVNDIFIEHMGYAPRKKINNAIDDVGNTYACKFSRHKSNLHIIGCSSERGDIIIQNTLNDLDSLNNQFDRNHMHDNAIFNIAWSDSAMKLVTACGDQTSKLCTFTSSGKLVDERNFLYGSTVTSVMFCPESSDIFCGSCANSAIKIWDIRSYNSNQVMQIDHYIPNTHGVYGISNRSEGRNAIAAFPVSSVIFKDDHSIISCSFMDDTIKLWDLRRTYHKISGATEHLPLLKYTIDAERRKRRKQIFRWEIGFIDMVINAQCTQLYASGTNKVIYRYSLDSDNLSE